MANRLIQNLIVAIIGIMSVPSAMAAGVMDMPLRPRVFEGYRELQEPRFGGEFPDPKVMAIVAREYQDSVTGGIRVGDSRLAREGDPHRPLRARFHLSADA